LLETFIHALASGQNHPNHGIQADGVGQDQCEGASGRSGCLNRSADTCTISAGGHAVHGMDSTSAFVTRFFQKIKDQTHRLILSRPARLKEARSKFAAITLTHS
jgi:hypothetical protein